MAVRVCENFAKIINVLLQSFIIHFSSEKIILLFNSQFFKKEEEREVNFIINVYIMTSTRDNTIHPSFLFLFR